MWLLIWLGLNLSTTLLYFLSVPSLFCYPFPYSAFFGINWLFKFHFISSLCLFAVTLCSVTVVIALGFTVHVFYLSPTVCYTKYLTERLDQWIFIFSQFWKVRVLPRSRVQQGWFLLMPLSLVCQQPFSCCVIHSNRPFSLSPCILTLSSSTDTSHTGLGSHLYDHI